MCPDDTLPLPPEPRSDANSATPVLVHLLSADRLRTPSSLHSLAAVDEVTIGRGVAAQVSCGREERRLTLELPDRYMSGAHARLLREDGGFAIEDNGSRNGTFVNGRAIERARLANGDLVELGCNFFLFGFAGAWSSDEPDVDDALYEDADLATLTPALAERLDALDKIARGTLSVVILGESGTGKELAARRVHQRSGRAGPFVAVNCGALPENLVMSELFGARRGAFSGAVDDRPGLVRAADGGTLFLDEVAELPASAQASLLRVLQEREVLAIGATKPVSVDVRVVVATHRDLGRMVTQRLFRDDLLARLSGFVVELPPLRKRREDLGLLVAQLLRRACGERLPRLSNEAARALLLHRWPLNVRELDQALRAAVALAGERIELAHLPAAIRASLKSTVAAAAGVAATAGVAAAAGAEPPARLARVPKIAQEELTALLRRHGGNISAVAREIDRDRVQVRRWIKHYGLDVSGFATDVGGDVSDVSAKR